MKTMVLELKIPHTNSADLPKQKLKKIYEPRAFPIGRNRIRQQDIHPWPIGGTNT